jgi:hypothetical protein
MYDNSAKVTKSIADAAMKVMMGESQQLEVLSEELKGDQHKIDANKNNKIDAHDFKLLRAKKEVKEEKDSCEDEAEEAVDKHEKKMHGKKGEVSKHEKEMHSEETEIEEGTKVQVAPGRTRNIGTHGRAQGSAFGGTDWDKEESEKEEKPKTRRKYGARQNYTRSTRVNESFTDMLETYNEGGVKALLGSLRTEIEIEEEATNDEFKAELDKAQAKSEGREKANVSQALVTASKRVDEEVEQLDELSKKTLGNYIGKAARDLKHSSTEYGRDIETGARNSDDDNVRRHSDKNYDKMQKRTGGLERAGSKIAKEEVELEERELSSSEKETKEKYVKGMKKGLQGFKQRYGDRAKEVMYATATKMAKKED